MVGGFPCNWPTQLAACISFHYAMIHRCDVYSDSPFPQIKVCLQAWLLAPGVALIPKQSCASTLINVQQNMGWVNDTSASVFHLPSTILWPTAVCHCLCSALLQLVLLVPSPCCLLLPMAALWAAACCFCCSRWEACMSNAVLLLWMDWITSKECILMNQL